MPKRRGKRWSRQVFFSWAPKSLWIVTAAMKLKDTCSLDGKLWQTHNRMLKSRVITLPTKVHIIKAMAFPVVMYVCESWSIKKAEYQRIDVFCLWCWRKLLRVSWTARKSNQSILQEIKLKYSLEGLFVQLKLQYLGHLMRRANSLEDSDGGKHRRQKEKGTAEDEVLR